ncbi:DUF2062 domain-containing protein [Roseovarius sp. EL26]|uniref:DUF2062 domain-containing protein n=1 Tax=Roseovarius sp. EL26 TaxID=2126672 RepID=UPI000EA0F103|nr:DUF2062 domain-containing protein [Roseovarius sp. EL26]
MVFKRRDKRPLWKAVTDFVWPKGGWARGFHYVKHRVRRLPDPPHRIARGIFSGILVTFTPFFGLHFFLAAGLAWLIRGNLVASLLSTFVGNPLTFPVIVTVSLRFGHYVLGRPMPTEVDEGLARIFWEAIKEFFWNIWAGITEANADWTRLSEFYHEIFLPYLVGGILPGLIAAFAGYYVSLPLIQAYQKRRKGVIKTKLAALKEKAASKADGRTKQD